MPFLCLVAAGGGWERGQTVTGAFDTGSAHIYPLGSEHEVECGSEGYTMLTIAPRNHWLSQQEYQSIFANQRSHHSARVLAYANRIRKVSTLEQSSTVNIPFADLLEAEAGILDLLSEFVRKRSRKPLGDWLKQLRSRIDADPFHNWAAHELASFTGRHPLHVGRAFRERYGESIGQYFRRRRLERCREMVEDGRLALIEIAHRAGFSDQSHFTRAYKRLFGQTPGETNVSAQRDSSPAPPPYTRPMWVSEGGGGRPLSGALRAPLPR